MPFLKKSVVLFLMPVLFIFLTAFILCGCNDENNKSKELEPEKQGKMEVDQVSLPSIKETKEELDLDVSIKDTIEKRRSIRTYEEGEVKLLELAALLWAGQGITDEERRFRAAPSAGATYPMEIYVAAGEVLGLEEGIYRYIPDKHELISVAKGDFREKIMDSALGQEPIKEAPMSILITSVYERVMSTYGDRGIRYAKIEAGHISQNIYLKTTALDLGTVSIGAFEDEEIAEILRLEEGEEPLYIMPVGRK